MRLLDLLESSTGYLAKNGVESPRLTTELLLAHVLEKTRMQLYLEYETIISDLQLDKLRPLVKKRAEGVPLEHLTGVKEFDGHKFKITPDVLIPRPETELLLEAVLPLVDAAASDLPIVDVGTGSGVLAVSLARRFPKIPVIAIDLSEKALAVARENGAGLANLTFRHGNLLDGWTGRAQLIVANLPYIPSGQINRLSREVRKEPMMTLDGGVDGLDLIRRLISDAATRTRWLALEFGDGQAPEIADIFKNHGCEITQVIPDLHKIDRIMIGKING
jgi:release factor glutamine methyltransferase